MPGKTNLSINLGYTWGKPQTNNNHKILLPSYTLPPSATEFHLGNGNFPLCTKNLSQGWSRVRWAGHLPCTWPSRVVEPHLAPRHHQECFLSPGPRLTPEHYWVWQKKKGGSRGTDPYTHYFYNHFSRFLGGQAVNPTCIQCSAPAVALCGPGHCWDLSAWIVPHAHDGE